MGNGHGSVPRWQCQRPSCMEGRGPDATPPEAAEAGGRGDEGMPFRGGERESRMHLTRMGSVGVHGTQCGQSQSMNCGRGGRGRVRWRVGRGEVRATRLGVAGRQWTMGSTGVSGQKWGQALACSRPFVRYGTERKGVKGPAGTAGMTGPGVHHKTGAGGLVQVKGRAIGCRGRECRTANDVCGRCW